MVELTTKARNKLGAAVFGLPKERKFPMNAPTHAANAKARATQGMAKGTLSPKAAAKGTLSPKAAAKVRAKANKILGRGRLKSDNDMDEGVKGLAASDNDGDELL